MHIFATKKVCSMFLPLKSLFKTLRVRANTHMYTRIHGTPLTYTHVHTQTNTHAQNNTCTHICTHTDTQTHAQTQQHTCTQVHVK